VIAAPRTQIERIIAGHQHLRELLAGGWIHLCALEQEECWEWDRTGCWRQAG
jgi:uncharacterized protein YbcC (UPF0753/DUF2309 family)